MLVIGNEVLSGRTREANAYLVAQKLFECGCRLGEIVVVPDIEANIIDTLNRLRLAYDAVITSGGIGPTHDDITMDSVAKALGVSLVEHPVAVKLMLERYGDEGMNGGRRRMTRVPKGAHLIRCEKTIAPGARVRNVYVLAGVPYIFESQLEAILPDFGEAPFIRREVDVELPESVFAEALEALQETHPDIEIGSYPRMCGNKPCGAICISGRDAVAVEQVVAEVAAMLKAISSKL